ncbi:forkhead box protein O4 [Lepisosteus oculatus]|uniref:forkhead box protein O4 n=1 Tax=Lepisosteus oculatus TaxID=7918 RepID=UPI0037222562
MEEEKVPAIAEIDPDFEPQSRPRSCTWPLPRPDISTVKQEGADGGVSAAATPPTEEEKQEPLPMDSEAEQAVIPEGGAPAGVGGVTPRKGSSRRNAWGNQSYADLISQAIENSPEKRLTLAQIYDWMVKTVPYFKDKGDSNSSAGWKNSIRHNLSLHSKFLRVHNESTGKSSWWMLNPEGGKSGKAPRRRAASMDNSSKLLKSRVRAKQTKKQQQGAAAGAGGAPGPADGPGGGADSPGPAPYPKWGARGASPPPRGGPEEPDVWTGFRPRTSSNASTLSGRLSPIAPGREDEDEPAPDELRPALAGYSAGSVPPTLTETLMEELDLIDGLTLVAPQPGGSPAAGAAPPPAGGAPTPLPAAATLLPRGTAFPGYRPLQPSKPAQQAGAQGGGSPSTPSGFSNSLFQPQPSSSPGRAGPFGGHVPSTLEALLTSDSPPPSDVMMTQVDPLMPSQGAAAAAAAGLLVLGGPLGGRGKAPGQHPLEKGPEQSSLAAALSLPLQQQQHALSQLGDPTPPQQLGLGLPVPGLGQDSAHLSALKAQLAQGQGSPSAGLLLAGGAQPTSGLPGMVPFGSSGCFLPGQDKLPTDLDIDMFTENLDCDVDYIINSDLMDGEGIDFNFDPILNASQSYPSSSTTQGSSHSWVPG